MQSIFWQDGVLQVGIKELETMAIHLLGISGSLRKASCNTGLLRAAQAHLPESATMDIADISDLPFFNTDIEKPESVDRFFE